MVRRPVFDRPIAHRGLHDRAGGVIENSASAFDRAIAAGFAIECDLQLSSDGVPVVFHDDTLERLTGRPGKVIDLTAAEVTALRLLGSSAGDRPQRFPEFLQQVAGRAMLQVELKRQYGPATRILAKAAAEAVRGYGGPLVFESFDPTLIRLMREYGFNGPCGIATERFGRAVDQDTYGLSGPQRFFLRHLLHFPWSRFDFVSAEQTALDLPMVRLFRALGKPVTSWTIRTPAAATAVGSKADQIVFEGFNPDRA
jgi:glycerophosphoryl diester phosphodiesterase